MGFNIYSTKQKGFTLLELLVVISIIGLLSTVVLAALNEARDRAKLSVAKKEVALLKEAIILAQGNTNKQLRQITGTGCSRCASCSTAGDLSVIPSTCYNRWVLSVDRIVAAAGDVYAGLGESLYLDPWGNPYLLDENEGENASNYCIRDTIKVAGPSNLYTSTVYNTTLPYTAYGQLNCSN